MSECVADLGLKMCNREREEILVASLPFSDDFNNHEKDNQFVDNLYLLIYLSITFHKLSI